MTCTTFVAVSVEPRRGALVVAAPARLLSPPTSRPRPSTHRAWRPPLRRAAAAGATPATSTSDAPVVVVGGGIVGCAVAYFLSERGRNVTVVEPVASPRRLAGRRAASSRGRGVTAVRRRSSTDADGTCTRSSLRGCRWRPTAGFLSTAWSERASGAADPRPRGCQALRRRLARSISKVERRYRRSN